MEILERAIVMLVVGTLVVYSYIACSLIKTGFVLYVNRDLEFFFSILKALTQTECLRFEFSVRMFHQEPK